MPSPFPKFKKMAYAEWGVLLSGWLSGMGFVFIAQGGLDGSHVWGKHDLEGGLAVSLVLAVPFLLMGIAFWSFKTCALPLLISSIVLIVFSDFGYYSVYFPETSEDAGWVFIMVPFMQTIFVCILSGAVYVFSKLQVWVSSKAKL